MPIFYRKNVHSFRNTVLLCQFFQNFQQKPLAVMPIFDQKRQVVVSCSVQCCGERSLAPRGVCGLAVWFRLVALYGSQVNPWSTNQTA